MDFETLHMKKNMFFPPLFKVPVLKSWENIFCWNGRYCHFSNLHTQGEKNGKFVSKSNFLRYRPINMTRKQTNKQKKLHEQYWLFLCKISSKYGRWCFVLKLGIWTIQSWKNLTNLFSDTYGWYVVGFVTFFY